MSFQKLRSLGIEEELYGDSRGSIFRSNSEGMLHQSRLSRTRVTFNPEQTMVFMPVSIILPSQVLRCTENSMACLGMRWIDSFQARFHTIELKTLKKFVQLLFFGEPFLLLRMRHLLILC